MNLLEDVPVEFNETPAPAHLLGVIDEATALRAAFYARTGDDRIPAFTGTAPDMAWSMLASLRAQVPECGESFCEWGSGLGIVTCLAEASGWRACGLEIDARLVEASTAFARKHGFTADFFEASYRVDDGSAAPDLAPGIGLFDFDVIFAYTWPAEKDTVTEIVRQGAKPGTLFVRYLGGAQLSVFRVVEDG